MNERTKEKPVFGCTHGDVTLEFSSIFASSTPRVQKGIRLASFGTSGTSALLIKSKQLFSADTDTLSSSRSLCAVTHYAVEYSSGRVPLARARACSRPRVPCTDTSDERERFRARSSSSTPVYNVYVYMYTSTFGQFPEETSDGHDSRAYQFTTCGSRSNQLHDLLCNMA